MSVKEDIEIASSNENKNEIKKSTRVIQYNPNPSDSKNNKEGYDIPSSATRSQKIQTNNLEEEIRKPTEEETKKKKSN